MKARDFFLCGVFYFAVRFLWSWKAFLHQNPAGVLTAARYLLFETAIFVATYWSLPRLFQKQIVLTPTGRQ